MSRIVPEGLRKVVRGSRNETGDPASVTKILREANGNVAYDIGANIGRVSTVLSNNFEQVFAFEPAIESYEVLKKNANPKIKSFNIAVSERNGFIELDVRGEHIAKGQLVNPETNLFDWGKTIEKRLVPSLTLDTLSESLPAPSFIKIDTEGYEAKIIGSGRRVIEERKTQFFVEIHGEQNGKYITGMLQESYYIDVIRHPGHSENSPNWANHYFLFAKPKG